MPVKRGTSNSNTRGNSSARRLRREWIMHEFAADVPGFCRCWRCGRLLDIVTMTVDRVLPQCKGGTYVKSNIRPACGYCNSLLGARLAQASRRAKAAAE